MIFCIEYPYWLRGERVENKVLLLQGSNFINKKQRKKATIVNS